ncbi:MAG: methylenetetrahydrofolate reductase C-terminal domain-containing protein [Thermodesulfobacteriota bacterium]|nr:methylenetetrahydrofolate reductase C-terminal domain-containing protein [Thermodesulfobacteriota bacterium]
MIVADRKPFEEIKAMLDGYAKVLVFGCGTCVSVCMAGGEKEAQILASQLRMAYDKEGKDVQVEDDTIQRQCDREYYEALKDKVDKYDVILSMACGAGVQLASELYENKVVLPGLNTTFIGIAQEEGLWDERCRACAQCVLGETGGICPITICPKGLLNGPCGGTNNGKCEVDKDKDCAWTLIYRRLEKQGRLDNIRKIHNPRNYKVSTTPSRRVHEAYDKEE